MKTAEQRCIKAHCACAPLSQVRVCAFHWAESNWGTAWAAKCHPDHPEAKSFVRAANERTSA